MKIKDYSDVLASFEQVKQHPKYQQYVDENRARIRLTEISYKSILNVISLRKN